MYTLIHFYTHECLHSDTLTCSVVHTFTCPHWYTGVRTDACVHEPTVYMWPFNLLIYQSGRGDPTESRHSSRHVPLGGFATNHALAGPKPKRPRDRKQTRPSAKGGIGDRLHRPNLSYLARQTRCFRRSRKIVAKQRTGKAKGTGSEGTGESTKPPGLRGRGLSWKRTRFLPDNS
jgi:hypothetical protein